MLPGNYFLAGLVSFLLAHLLYIVGFSLRNPVLIPGLDRRPVWCDRLCSLRDQENPSGCLPEDRRQAYALVGHHVQHRRYRHVPISLSTIQKPGWSPSNYFAVALGGMLFYLSDTLLAYDRFVIPIRYGRLIVRITYHLGQIFS